MILRRLANALQRQDWAAVVIELTIVVLGIFLGFQLTAWNEAREERAQEALYLQRLEQDFDYIIGRLEAGLAATRASVASGQVLLDYVEAPAAGGEGPSREVAAAALGRIGTSAVPAGRSATFTEMVSSGDLSIIRDDGLRDALFEYDLAVSGNRESWRVLRQSIIEEQRRVFSYFEAEFGLEDGEPFLRITGFDEEGFRADARVPPAIGIIAGVSINENQLLRQQLDRARRVRESIPATED